MLEKGRQSQTVVVLDTCFSGRDSGGELLAEGTQPVIPVGVTADVAAGTVVLSAAGTDEVAGQLPGAERPAFSYLLLGALRGWADDGDGSVTADEAITWTRQQLRHAKGRQQTPGVDGDKAIALAPGATEPDPGVAALMKGGGTNAAAAASAPSDVAGGTVIDTNEGLVFTKPADWGVGPAGMGVILSLSNQYSGNQIFVQRAQLKQANAAAALGLPFGAEVKVVRKPVQTTHGSTEGQESEYKLEDADPEFESMPSQHHIKFGTYQNGAAWSFVLQINDPNSRDADYEAFKQFLEQVRFQ